jgi:hypothetical protein
MSWFKTRPSDQQVEQRGIASFLDLLCAAAMQAQASHGLDDDYTISGLLTEARARIEHGESSTLIAASLARALVGTRAALVQAQKREGPLRILVKQLEEEKNGLQEALGELQARVEALSARQMEARLTKLEKERNDLRAKLAALREEKLAQQREYERRIQKSETELSEYEETIVLDGVWSREQLR